MFPKVHLTLHSRTSGSRWVITPSWLSGSWRSFLYSSSVYSCHLFLLSSASVRSRAFLSFIKPIFAWNVPLVSLIFLKRSLLLFSSTDLFSISLPWSLRKCYLSMLFFETVPSNGYLSFPPLLCASFPLTAICKAYSNSHFAFLHFFFGGWSWSLSPVQCHRPLSIVHQALWLSVLIPWIYFSLPLYNGK